VASGPRFVLPYQTVIDASGVPIPGALLFFYLSGTDTPANTYADFGLTTPNANPVQANSAGVFPNIFMDPSIIYKVVLTDSLLDQIWTADPVFGASGAAGGAGFVQVAANYVVKEADTIVEVDATGGVRAITVPISRSPGNPVTIVKVDATANQVQITDGAVARGFLVQPAIGAIVQSQVVYSDGTALKLVTWP
jgi:hypothetical protein